MSFKRSAVWNYFTVSEEDPQKVKCSICPTKMSFKGGSTRNLIRHIRALHPDVHDSCLNLNGKMDLEQLELAEMQEYEYAVEEEQQEHNLMDESTDMPEGNGNNEDSQLLIKMKKRKRSEIWQHYSDVEDLSNKDADLAKCIHCEGVISYTGGSIGNLMRHIKTKHRSILCEKSDDLSKNCDTESQTKPAIEAEDSVNNDDDLLIRLKKGKLKRKRSEIWQHFSVDVISNKDVDLAKCIHCKGFISYKGGSIGNLMRHIKNKHSSKLCEKNDDFSTSISKNYDLESEPETKLHVEDSVFTDKEYSCESSDDYCEYDERKRSTNFTHQEKKDLIMVVKKFVQHVECRKMDRKSKRMKQLAWTNIEKDFNNLSRAIYRDKKVLRKKYENMRIRIREKYESIAKQGYFRDPLDRLNEVEKDVIEIIQSNNQFIGNEKIGEKSTLHVDNDVEFTAVSDTSNKLSEKQGNYENPLDGLNEVERDAIEILRRSDQCIDNQIIEPVELSNYVEIPEPHEQIHVLQIGNVDSLASTELPKNFKKETPTKHANMQSNRNRHIRSAKRLRAPYRKIQAWLGAKEKYIQMQNHFLSVEHSQTIKFQAAEHAEKMKMLKLQQLLIRKQIEVEEQKLRDKS